MTLPKEKTWSIKPHTKAKHLILQKYLQAWFPILAKGNRRIVYYDGFAGPGVYSNGEKGSPLIALNVAKDHDYLPDTELVFVFVEENKNRSDALKRVIEGQEKTLPENFCCYVENEKFETALGKTLDFLDKENLGIAPAFAFIDPFGIKGVPFSLIKRFLKNDNCEVLITFMDSTIQRFVDELSEQVNELIGNPSASDIIIESSGDRTAKAIELYYNSLKKTARFVRPFKMESKRRRSIYHLFFATNHPRGHEKMKEAMWAVDKSGLFRFSYATDPNQKDLYTPGEYLAPILGKKFQGKVVASDEVLEYTSNEPNFLKTHAREALKLLESENGYQGYGIQVEPIKRNGKPRRRGTFPSGTIITFRKLC